VEPDYVDWDYLDVADVMNKCTICVWAHAFICVSSSRYLQNGKMRTL